MCSWARLKFLPSPRLTEGVDYLKLCEETAHAIENLIPTRGTHLLNRRQCQDLSGKILETVKNSREIVFGTRASPGLFNTALEYLYLHLEKARLLVSSCAAGDWCEAAVFQIQNENAFREVLIGIGLCYNVIYEQANSCCSTTHPEDLRKSSTFLPATDSDVHGDEEELQRWLENLVNEPSGIILPADDRSKAAKRALQQCLARYLLVKMKFRSEQSETNRFDECRAILWTKEPDHPEAWGNSKFIGGGSGASGVCSTEWLGILCAKKSFKYPANQPIFTKEAAILAGLQHPRIVNFISCGNDQQEGLYFIAMELMEKSLFDLIEEQVRNGKEHFSLLVVVDMMAQMARGMLYLHDQGVAHRDLKPQNVVVKRLTFPHLYAQYYCVKLVDFGMSKTKIEVSKYNTISDPGVGTARYRAPEVHPKAHSTITDSPKVNWFKADAYSFAITCAHLLTLEVPFKDAGNSYEKLSSGKRPELPREYCPEELVSLLTACWDANPRSRPRFGEIFTRLEKFHHELLRRSPGDEGSRKARTNSTSCFGFITRTMKLQCPVNKDDICYDPSDDNAAQGEVGEISIEEDLYETCIAEKLEAEIDCEEVVSTITCTSNHALVLLTKSAYQKDFICNICRKQGTGGDYHCKTCDFDAHPDCAVVKKEVTVSFRQAQLHLELQIYRKDNPDHAASCGICQEPLEDKEWVYKSTRSFYAHVLCTKYPAEMSHLRFENHSLTLAESPSTCKFCNCCNGSIKGYYYTCESCAPQQCSFDLHPFCAILPAAPYCMNGTGTHYLSLVTNECSFQCEKCQSTSWSVWHYHCERCGVNTCLDCFGNTEEDDLDWNLAFETFTSKNHAEADVLEWDNIKANMISKLVDGLSVGDSPAPAAMKINPKMKAKSRLPGHEAKLKNVEELEIFLQNLQHHNDSELSPADLEFLAASLEKLHLHRAKVLGRLDTTDPCVTSQQLSV